MTYLEATTYGAIQGLAEFLPISSSAHLILAPWFLGWKDPGLSFDVALHLGTLLAIVIYFYKDWLEIFSGTLKDLKGPQARLFFLLAAASVPAAVAGLAFEKQAEFLFRDPARIAWALIIFALFLAFADRWGAKKTPLNRIKTHAALSVGLAQALAIVPGVSRSGATMTAALGFGLESAAAARFSFLLASPVIFGAALLKLRHLHSADLSGPFLWAVAVSALTGLAAVHFFLNQLRRSSLLPYAIYRIVLGIAVLFLK